MLPGIGELDNVGANAGKVALDMLTLDNPAIGWVGITGNLGVEAARAEDMETFADLFTAANRRSGPFVIELRRGLPFASRDRAAGQRSASIERCGCFPSGQLLAQPAFASINDRPTVSAGSSPRRAIFAP